MRPETIQSLRELRSNLRKAAAYITERLSRDAQDLEQANAQIEDLSRLIRDNDPTGESE